ncbi:bactofilin family protein [Zhaonella formicivorans]|uniref:bactofilin family protein n=1 Tax=Zhaonella formicivorans TaxID=2528593 RepID=UPI001D0F7093|nr:polymer-forming cytoskeletal protein [Zhaonella formicivorans]
MFGKKEEAAFDKFETLIGKDTIFRGVLQASGTIRVEGSFQGEVNSQGDVVVSETGRLEANVKARNLLVAGFLKGDVEVTGKIQLASTGKIYGNVQAAGLIIDEGGVLHGNCLMDKDEIDEEKGPRRMPEDSKNKIQPVA